MTVQGRVVIGPEFFQKSVIDYQDRRWALVREFLQNSIDAKSTVIDLVLTSESLKVADNGIGMDEDVLLNKLLRLGESGKSFRGAIHILNRSFGWRMPGREKRKDQPASVATGVATGVLTVGWDEWKKLWQEDKARREVERAARGREEVTSC